MSFFRNIYFGSEVEMHRQKVLQNQTDESSKFQSKSNESSVDGETLSPGNWIYYFFKGL